MESSGKQRGDAKLMRIMASHFQKATREPEEFVQFAIDESDPQTWYLKVRNLSGKNGELEGGEYLFEMWAPPEFPFKPPKFTALTPNGVYEVNQSICISIGEYHADQYRATLGMLGFAKELANGIMCWTDLGHGIGIIHMHNSIDDKRQWARASREYNLKHNPKILRKIEDSFDEYSRKWDLSKIDARLASRLGLVKSEVPAAMP
jgi:ubiquitin-protein ligase